MISLDKKYTTRIGNTVRIYAIDGRGSYPIHGAVKCEDGWNAEEWTDTGKFRSDNREAPLDLVEVLPFTVGQTFETRNGLDATIIYIDPDAQVRYNIITKIGCRLHMHSHEGIHKENPDLNLIMPYEDQPD